ncbi:MAG: DUF4252 domain-containing protein [Exilibacterium sp.]
MRFVQKIACSVASMFLMIGMLAGCSAMAAPPGAIDFPDLSHHYGDAVVETSLDKGMLGLIGILANSEEPELAEIISGVKSVIIRVYNVNGKREQALAGLHQVSAQIRRDKWEPLISVNDKESQVRLFAKMNEGKMDGLVAMVVSEDDAVFINVVGEIDPAKLVHLTKAMNIEYDNSQT